MTSTISGGRLSPFLKSSTRINNGKMSCKMIRGSCGRRFRSPEDSLPYIVWDSTGNVDEVYGPTASLHSHPASIITYNHIPPMINSSCIQSSPSTSSSSWDSSSSSSRRCCSPACCAILLTALLILAALLTVIGVSVYLGIITSLSKATILPVSGRFRVISGDDFSPKLFNTSSNDFLSKAEKYNAIINSAFQWTAIESSIIKSEVYAFRKGSLIVYFRIYLDRKKVLASRSASSGRSFQAINRDQVRVTGSVSPSSLRGEYVIPNYIQEELKEGLNQLQMIGSKRPEIDLASLIITPYHTDPLLNLKESPMTLKSTKDILYNRDDSVDSAMVTTVYLKTLSTTRKPVTNKPTTAATTTTTTTLAPAPTPIKSIFQRNHGRPLFATSISNITSSVERQTHAGLLASINRLKPRLRPPRPATTTTTTTTATTTTPRPTTKLTSTSTTSTTTTTTTSTTTTTTTTTKPPTTRRQRSTTVTPLRSSTESEKSQFTRKTNRNRFGELFRSTTKPTKSSTSPTTTESVGTMAPIPNNHKPNPGTLIKVTSLDFGQWRPLSPFRPLSSQSSSSSLNPSTTHNRQKLERPQVSSTSSGSPDRVMNRLRVKTSQNKLRSRPVLS